MRAMAAVARATCAVDATGTAWVSANWPPAATAGASAAAAAAGVAMGAFDDAAAAAAAAVDLGEDAMLSLFVAPPPGTLAAALPCLRRMGLPGSVGIGAAPPWDVLPGMPRALEAIYSGAGLPGAVPLLSSQPWVGAAAASIVVPSARAAGLLSAAVATAVAQTIRLPLTLSSLLADAPTTSLVAVEVAGGVCIGTPTNGDTSGAVVALVPAAAARTVMTGGAAAAVGGAVCPCSDDTYVTADGACAACPLGSNLTSATRPANPTHTAADCQCALGYGMRVDASTGAGECYPCPLGTYGATPNVCTSCGNSPNLTTPTVATTSLTACMCRAGYRITSGGGPRTPQSYSCGPCTADTASLGLFASTSPQKDACLPCGDGFWAPAGSTTCSPCAAGVLCGADASGRRTVGGLSYDNDTVLAPSVGAPAVTSAGVWLIVPDVINVHRTLSTTPAVRLTICPLPGRCKAIWQGADSAVPALRTLYTTAQFTGCGNSTVGAACTMCAAGTLATRGGPDCVPCAGATSLLLAVGSVTMVLQLLAMAVAVSSKNANSLARIALACVIGWSTISTTLSIFVELNTAVPVALTERLTPAVWFNPVAAFGHGTYCAAGWAHDAYAPTRLVAGVATFLSAAVVFACIAWRQLAVEDAAARRHAASSVVVGNSSSSSSSRAARVARAGGAGSSGPEWVPAPPGKTRVGHTFAARIGIAIARGIVQAATLYAAPLVGVALSATRRYTNGDDAVVPFDESLGVWVAGWVIAGAGVVALAAAVLIGRAYPRHPAWSPAAVVLAAHQPALLSGRMHASLATVWRTAGHAVSARWAAVASAAADMAYGRPAVVWPLPPVDVEKADATPGRGRATPAAAAAHAAGRRVTLALHHLPNYALAGQAWLCVLAGVMAWLHAEAEQLAPTVMVLAAAAATTPIIAPYAYTVYTAAACLTPTAVGLAAIASAVRPDALSLPTVAVTAQVAVIVAAVLTALPFAAALWRSVAAHVHDVRSSYRHRRTAQALAPAPGTSVESKVPHPFAGAGAGVAHSSQPVGAVTGIAGAGTAGEVHRCSDASGSTTSELPLILDGVSDGVVSRGGGSSFAVSPGPRSLTSPNPLALFTGGAGGGDVTAVANPLLLFTGTAGGGDVTAAVANPLAVRRTPGPSPLTVRRL